MSFSATIIGIGRAAVTPPGRDVRIDVLRGLALLTIFVNHIPGNWLAALTTHHYGFSDAADVFVFLAGIAATFAYGRLINERGLLVGSLKVAGRVFTLYIVHLAMLALVIGLVAAAAARTQNPLYLEAINILPVFDNAPVTVQKALVLAFQPSYLDILPLYMVLLALFPLIYRLAVMSPLAALAVSFGLWAMARGFGFNLPSLSGGWFFNPLAWQLVFTLGVVAGRLAMLGVALPRSRLVDAGAGAVLVAALLVKWPWGDIQSALGLTMLVDWADLYLDKSNLSIWRVIHLAALIWVLMRLVPRDAGWLSRAPAVALAKVGRHSLEVFAVGVILSILGQIVLTEGGHGWQAQLVVNAIGITLLLGLGGFLSWFKKVSSAPVSAARLAAAPPSVSAS